VTTMAIDRRMFRESGALTTRSMAESLLLHIIMLALLMIVGAPLLLRKTPPRNNKQIDIVFYRPPAVPVPAPAVTPPGPRDTRGPAAPKPAPKPLEVPEGPGKPELQPGPEITAEAKPNVGKAGILAFKEKFASLAEDQNAPRLGNDARYGAADDVGRSSSRSTLTTNTPGVSGGIDSASLNHSVGGGGGGKGGGAGGGGIPGVTVARATSSIASIGGGGDRPKAHSGAGAARTDEEIQIVFDRYKASFYRLYNRELRNNPALQGKMVLRLTIEPDGSVSMCVLQSTDMDAPDLAAQVVSRVKTINFGAKDSVPAVTIVYPIDFLPAS
jgi:hypothetical protein